MSNRSTRQGYDAVAARYAVEIGDELAGKPLDRSLLAMMAELCSGTVLDLGCGPGQVGAYLSDLGVEMVCSDLSPAMCAIAAHRVRSVAADLTALPFRTSSAAGVVCLYAVIHLETAERARAYAEVARVLAPGGHALVSFHTSDANTSTGAAQRTTTWWDKDVDLTFRFLDPVGEIDTATASGLELVARLERAPYEGVEHTSERCYLLLRRV